ncbi:MAG TPA: ABC transporter ATP-binding protein [Gaiellales bacterium]|nr:ABC transporter ATP-binding protein [Gaiellales bacterium]
MKRFGEVTAVRELTLDVADGEFVVLVGPSGCGKTTALRMLAGLEAVSSGRILIGDSEVQQLPPRQRDVAMVFQDYALYPQMSVYRNLAFGLQTRKVPLEISSRPAIIRRLVVLPQPDGPTRTMNSPSPMSRLRSLTAWKSP